MRRKTHQTNRDDTESDAFMGSPKELKRLKTGPRLTQTINSSLQQPPISAKACINPYSHEQADSHP